MCALDALRCACGEHPPPKREGRDVDVLAHALAMFEDLQVWLDPIRKEQAALVSVKRAAFGRGDGPLQ